MVNSHLKNLSEMVKNASKKMPEMDREAMIKSHRRNMEALTEANKTALEVMKSIAQLQSQYIKQTFEDFASIMKDSIANPPAAKDAVEKHTSHAKDQFTRAWEHGNAITTTLAQSNKEIFDIMHSRMSENAHEAVNLAAKAKATKH